MFDIEKKVETKYEGLIITNAGLWIVCYLH